MFSFHIVLWGHRLKARSLIVVVFGILIGVKCRLYNKYNQRLQKCSLKYFSVNIFYHNFIGFFYLQLRRVLL